MASARPIGPNVLITGANRGIGFGLVQVLLKTPCVKRIFATCPDLDQTNDLKELQKLSAVVRIVHMDVTDDASIKKAFECVSKDLDGEGLNLLVNNAGIFGRDGGTGLDDVDRTAYLRHFDINTVSVAVVTGTLLPLVRRAASTGGPARIVNISYHIASIAIADTYFPMLQGDDNVVYAMSKAALNLYTRALAGNEMKNGIIVACFCPGWVRTFIGKQRAALSIEESTTALINIISKTTMTHTGRYMTREGDPLAF